MMEYKIKVMCVSLMKVLKAEALYIEFVNFVVIKRFFNLRNENSSLPRSRLKVLEAALVIEIIFHFLVFL